MDEEAVRAGEAIIHDHADELVIDPLPPYSRMCPW